jgi:hypothetical protein
MGAEMREELSEKREHRRSDPWQLSIYCSAVNNLSTITA